MFKRILTGIWIATLSTTSFAAPKPVRVVDWQQKRQDLGIAKYDQFVNPSDSAILIIGKGFESLSPEISAYLNFLPSPYTILSGERVGQGDDGMAMAAYVSALLGYSDKGPELLLAAVEDEAQLIEALKSVGNRPVSAVISSVTFPENAVTGSELKDAITNFLNDKKCPWIQASGEKRVMTALGKPTFIGSEKFLNWDRNLAGLELVSHLAFLPLKITLSAYTRAPGKQSPSNAEIKFCVFRGKKGVAIDKHIQEGCSEWAQGVSSLKLTLDANDGDSFYLYAQTKAGKEIVDKMRLVFEVEPLTDRKIQGADGVARNFELRGGYLGGMGIKSPADLDELIVVGSSENSAGGPSALGEPKPNILVDQARVAFNDGRDFTGSAIAAAEVGAQVVQMRSFEPRFVSRDDVVAFRTYWPRLNMAKAGWTFDPSTLEALVKKHPGVTKYLAGKIKGNWVGVVKDSKGNFTVATTNAPNTLGQFNEKAGEQNLHFFSAPAFDITGNSVTTHVVPASKDGRSLYVPTENFKPELAVQVIQLAVPSVREEVQEDGGILVSDRTPLFFAMPEPTELVEFIAYKRLNQSRVPARYAESTYSFPEKLFELIPKPVVQKPKVVETPQPRVEPLPSRESYVTTELHVLNRQSHSLKVYIKYKDGTGSWVEKNLTLAAGESRYVGRVAEGSNYYSDAEGFNGGWDDVGHNKAWVRQRF